MPTKYQLTQDVDDKGTYGNPLKAGDIVYACVKSTYGCCDDRIETAVTLDPTGDYPFFGCPNEALKEVQ